MGPSEASLGAVPFVAFPASLAPSSSEQPSAEPPSLLHTSLTSSLVALVASPRARLRPRLEIGSLAFSCRLCFRVACAFFVA